MSRRTSSERTGPESDLDRDLFPDRTPPGPDRSRDHGGDGDAGRRRSGGDDRGRDADAPQEIPARGWLDVLSRVKVEAKQDNVVLLSAGVAFFALLALVPALIAAVSVYGLVADPEQVTRQIRDVASGLPSEARGLLVDQMESVVSNSSASLSMAALGGVLIALWSASSGVKHLMEALNAAYDEDETRGFVKLRATALLLTVGAVVFVVVTIGLITALPRLLEETALGDAARTAIELARWPLLLVGFAVGCSILYRVAPDRDDAKWRWVSWGAGLATVLWIVGTLAFSFYTSNFGSYNETYGSLAGIIVLMLWLLLTAASVVLGAELNAELERQTRRDSTRDRPRPMGRRGAEAADTLGATRERLADGGDGAVDVREPQQADAGR
jgi:membrane protein